MIMKNNENEAQKGVESGIRGSGRVDDIMLKAAN
jgi:hypothetical protein